MRSRGAEADVTKNVAAAAFYLQAFRHIFFTARMDPDFPYANPDGRHWLPIVGLEAILDAGQLTPRALAGLVPEMHVQHCGYR